MTLVEIIVVFCIVTFGALIQGSVGFGMGLVSAPLLANLDPLLVPAPLLCGQIVLTALVAHRNRQDIDFPQLRWAMIGALPGVMVGGVILRVVPAHEIGVVFGVGLLLAVGFSVVGTRLVVRRRTLIATGLCSGILSTTVSVGGPPMALLLQHEHGSKLRGMLAGFFLASLGASLVVLALIGRFGIVELSLAAMVVPAAVVGFVLSGWGANVLDQRAVRSFVLLLAAISGIVLIVRYLSA